MLCTQGMDFGATVALLGFVFVPPSQFWGPKSKGLFNYQNVLEESRNQSDF